MRRKRNVALDIMSIRRRVFAGEEWTASGGSVIMAGKEIGQMKEPRIATLICDLHNSYLPLANAALMLQKRLNDSQRRFE